MADLSLSKEITSSLKGMVSNLNTDRLTELLVAVLLGGSWFFNCTDYF